MSKFFVSQQDRSVSRSTIWSLSVGLYKKGEIHVAGRNSEEILDEISNNKSNWSNIVAVSAGGGDMTKSGSGERGHIVALKDDHTAVAAGDNGRGQCNVTGPEWVWPCRNFCWSLSHCGSESGWNSSYDTN